MDVQIRKYDPRLSDKAEIERVCFDCAFLGEPLDPIFKDKAWFGNLMIAPYLSLEPEHTWVAEADGAIVGYLTGSTIPSFPYVRLQMVASSILFELIPNYVLGSYEDHPRSKRFVEFLIFQALIQVPAHPRDAAHFHFNVQKAFRGSGIGTRLVMEFERMLKRTGIRRYYAEVMSSETTRPETYFIGLGYDIYDKVRTTVFEPEIEELHVLCIDKRLQ